MNFLLNLLFPRRCVSCGRLGKYICPKCVSMIQYIDTEVCPVCERPAINGITHPRCQTKYSLDGLTSFFVYDGPIKKAIKLLKYKFVTDLANELISLVSLEGSTLYKVEPSQQTAFTPVPLHWRRSLWRGFNQSELLGKMISTKLKTRFVPDLLVRKRFTKPQVELRGKGRQENILDAFAINPRYISANQRATQKIIQGHEAVSVSLNQRQSKPTKVLPSNVLIFDDVWTTGATLKSCAMVLKESGAKKVWGMTLAR